MLAQFLSTRDPQVPTHLVICSKLFRRRNMLWDTSVISGNLILKWINILCTNCPIRSVQLKKYLLWLWCIEYRASAGNCDRGLSQRAQIVQHYSPSFWISLPFETTGHRRETEQVSPALPQENLIGPAQVVAVPDKVVLPKHPPLDRLASEPVTDWNSPGKERYQG